jgi:hypothetical protein
MVSKQKQQQTDKENIHRYEINKRKTSTCHQVGSLDKFPGADGYDLVGHVDLLGQ